MILIKHNRLILKHNRLILKHSRFILVALLFPGRYEKNIFHKTNIKKISN